MTREKLPTLEKLRLQTQDIHQELEASPLLAQLVSRDFVMHDYQCLLQKLFACYFPYEQAMMNFIQHADLDYHYQSKHPLLIEDLHYLDIEKPNVSSLEAQIQNHEKFLASLYVFEGATLGGKVITKSLKRHLPVDKAARFFNPYEKNTKRQWEQTRQFIQSEVDSRRLDEHAICDYAIQQFRDLKESINGEF